MECFKIFIFYFHYLLHVESLGGGGRGGGCASEEEEEILCRGLV